MHVAFTGPEYHADGVFRPGRYAFTGDCDGGWTVERDGRDHLRLARGYRLVATRYCGICSTDLARQHLPFPLPQITGHEVIAADDGGTLYAVEINASHRARGLADGCAFCGAGLDTHCPDRLVLGIHDLPGGFGPYVLAPIDALVPIPPSMPAHAATIAEPLAAALHAVEAVSPQNGDTIAVLGPRKLGMLVVAALAAYRRRHARSYEIVAIVRRQALGDLARVCGADRVLDAAGPLDPQCADVVVDTTGSPEALALAVDLARREVHLKSTHGRPAAGLRQLTALVVDEIEIGRFPSSRERWREALERHRMASDRPPLVAWLARCEPPAWLRAVADVRATQSPALLLEQLEATANGTRPPRADLAVVDDAATVDAVIRPLPTREVALVRPRGAVLLTGAAQRPSSSPLVDAIVSRDLKLGSTRCGRLRASLDLMDRDRRLVEIADRLITHRCAPDAMNEAFALAQSPACIKALVVHPS